VIRYSGQFNDDSSGVSRPIAGASIYVYRQSDGSLATLGSDAGGTSLANPVQTDTYGDFSFYAAQGIYDLVYYVGGRAVFRENGVIVGDAIVLTSATADQIITSDASNVQAALDGLDTDVAAAGADIDEISDWRTAEIRAKVRQRLKVREEAALAYLPTLTTAGASYYECCFTERLISTYVGPLLRTAAAVDLGTGAVRVKPFDIQNLRGAAVNVKLDKVYDQAGSARDNVQTTAANRPVAHEDGTINGHLAITFPQSEAGANRISDFESPAVSIDRQDFTMFFVMDPTASLKNQVYLRGEIDSTTPGFNLFSLSSGTVVDNGKAGVNFAGTIRQTHKYIPASPHILTFVGNGTDFDVWIDDVNVTLTNTAATITKLFFGADPTSGFFANFRGGGRLTVNKAVNAADRVAIWQTLRSRYDLSTDYDATIAISGTSRDVAGQADNAFTRWFYVQKLLTRNFRFFNMAQDGQPQSTALANFAATIAATYTATMPWMLILGDFINDIGGLGTTSDPNLLYTNIAGGFLTAARAQGSNVIVGICTTAHQNSSGVYPRTSAAIEADVLTFNSLVRANSLGFDFVIDTAASPGMDSIADTADITKYLADKLHEQALGNFLQAPTSAAGIEAAL
jgi:hypothetical protein